MHEGLRANPDLVAEHSGDFVRVPGATDVAKQRNPVDRFGQLRIEPGVVAHR